MPFSELSQPSLALGLLTACCADEGLEARVLPANIWFSEEFGVSLHNLIFEAYSTTLLGEWVFSHALFPDFAPDDDAYLRRSIRLLKLDGTVYWQRLKQAFPYVDHVLLLRTLREEVPRFVESVAKKVLAHNPKVVGCTSMFQQQCSSLALLKAIKALDPSVVTMLGGANCDGAMGRKSFELYPFVDYLVSGEADGFFGPLCRQAIDGSDHSLFDFPEGVYGPWDREEEGRFLPLALVPPPGEDLAPIARLEQMDTSPVPNYDDYFAALKESALGDYVRPALPFQTARGCWWGEKSHCSFCGISKSAMKFRSKSAGNVMQQMYELRDKYGINTFQGTEYIFDWRYFTTLLPELKKLKLAFASRSRPTSRTTRSPVWLRLECLRSSLELRACTTAFSLCYVKGPRLYAMCLF
jgi:magnesium-protoporphyrin IX monomethyl ester (oxidative) cyclase